VRNHNDVFPVLDVILCKVQTNFLVFFIFFSNFSLYLLLLWWLWYSNKIPYFSLLCSFTDTTDWGKRCDFS